MRLNFAMEVKCLRGCVCECMKVRMHACTWWQLLRIHACFVFISNLFLSSYNLGMFVASAGEISKFIVYFLNNHFKSNNMPNHHCDSVF